MGPQEEKQRSILTATTATDDHVGHHCAHETTIVGHVLDY